MVSSPLKPHLGNQCSILLSIAAGFMIVGCSAVREDIRASSDAAPAFEVSSSQLNGGLASVDATTSSDAPLAASEEDEIRSQIESNWNLRELAGSPGLAGMVVELRLSLLPDGTIADVKLLNDRPGNRSFRQVADSAIRAVKISSPLKLRPGREFSALILRFRPDWEHP